MSETTILLVDDEKEIIDLIEIYLNNEGYRVLKATTGEDALELIQNQTISLLVLDIMMPGIDGLEVCRRVREGNPLPIILLSSKSQDMDKILGLGIGADDYMTKPFNPIELIARIKAQLRRYLYLNQTKASFDSNKVLEVGPLSINIDNHQVTLNEHLVSLTPTEFKILLLLAKYPNRTFSTEEIFEKVWEEKYYESNNTVMVHIWRLREKLEPDPKNPTIIKTVWGVGYLIEA